MIADKIRKYRKQKGLTQKELAISVGVSTGYIQMLELKKKKNPSLDVLNKLAEVLEVPISEFIEDKNPIRTVRDKISEIKGLLFDLSINKEQKYNIFDSLVEELTEDPTNEELKKKVENAEKECNDIDHYISVSEINLDNLMKKFNELTSKAYTYKELGDFFIDNNEIEEGKRLLDEIESENLRNRLLQVFDKLNNSGKIEAIKRVTELSQLKTYTKDETIVINHDEAIDQPNETTK